MRTSVTPKIRKVYEGKLMLIQGFNDGLPYGLGQAWSQSVVFTILILVTGTK